MNYLTTQQQNKINKILSDKTSGSSEIVNKINTLFKSNRSDTNFIKESIPIFKNQLIHFAAIKNYLENVNELLNLNDQNSLSDFLSSFANEENAKYKFIFKKLYKKIKRSNSIITISKSGTLTEILKLWVKENKNLKVVITESRPGNEGKILAKELLKFGIKVELISDTMTAIYVPQVDAAIIGADEVLKNNHVINKVGSKALALFCKEHKKPFYVVTTKSKYSRRTKFFPLKEDPSKLWNYKSERLTVSNIYFEEIEKKFITEIIAD